jgi:hypothetical protein
MPEPIHLVVAFYNGRAGAENLIKEANNDAGLAARLDSFHSPNSNLFKCLVVKGTSVAALHASLYPMSTYL